MKTTTDENNDLTQTELFDTIGMAAARVTQDIAARRESSATSNQSQPVPPMPLLMVKALEAVLAPRQTKREFRGAYGKPQAARAKSRSQPTRRE